jgi:hypothetical protein
MNASRFRFDNFPKTDPTRISSAIGLSKLATFYKSVVAVGSIVGAMSTTPGGVTAVLFMLITAGRCVDR